jgi:hypothetical protein
MKSMKTILGITISWGDIQDSKVYYDKVLNVNGDMRVPLKNTFNSSDFFIPI